MATQKTTPPTLTDRYIAAVLRSLPAAQRAGLDPELRERIADAIDAQRAAGVAAERAEEAALVGLGEPGRLAASYAERPAHLIGPAYYFEWRRLTLLLLSLVLPLAVTALLVIELFRGTAFGPALGGTIGLGMTIAVHLVFWPTLVFAVLERRPGALGLPSSWSPELLPPLGERESSGRGEFIAAAVFIPIGILALLWQQLASPTLNAAGEPVPWLHPALWSFWLPVFIALGVAELLLALWVWRSGGFGWAQAGVNAALSLGFAVPAIWLVVTGQVLNPELLATIGWTDTEQHRIAAGVTAAAIAAISLWDAFDGFRRAWLRSREA